MKRLYLIIAVVLASLAALSVGILSVSAHDPDDDRAKFEVTITNLTKGQIFSPAVVATHNKKFSPLFELGSAASTELAMVAEDALNGDLVAALEGDSNVKDVQVTPGPIMPGATVSVMVETNKRNGHVSLAGMLVTTNDAFYALNGVHGGSTYYSPAYDSGTEANSEACMYIPGPPCGNGGVHDDTAEAEGYVHIHSGVHGVGDLDPAMHDWRNPVAKITITKIGG